MVKHSLNGIVVRALDALQLQLLEMNLEELDNNELITDFTMSFKFDKKQNCIWYWNLEEYLYNANRKGHLTEIEYEDILMKIYLNIDA